MRLISILLAGLTPFVARAQTGVYAYVPAQNKFLKLKSSGVGSTVMGAIVRTSADYIYESPSPLPLEVSFNFELPATSTLGGFGYFDGESFVQGRLQAKGTAGTVNSAAGRGLRVTAILDQRSPTVYRCEVFPSRPGSQLHIRVWSLDMLHVDGVRAFIPKPESGVQLRPNTPSWSVRSVSAIRPNAIDEQISMGLASPMAADAQKFSDGKYYVAGYLHTDHPQEPQLRIERAYYEPSSSQQGGKDVTAKVQEIVKQRKYSIWASDAMFGDPSPGVAKQLRVIAKIAGREITLTVPEDATMSLLGLGGNSLKPMIHGLHDVKTVFQDPGTVAFFGWTPNPEMITTTFQGKRFETRAKWIPGTTDAARLWAQQMLATNSVREPQQVLAFSLKYGILSEDTAMVSIWKTQPLIPIGY